LVNVSNNTVKNIFENGMISKLFLFFSLHLFKCVALLCIFVFIIILLIYMWNSYVFSYDTRNIYYLCLFLSHPLTMKNFLSNRILNNNGSLNL